MTKKKLKFNSKKHEYRVGDKRLVSVTQFIHSFFKPFDAKEIARKLAKFPINKANKRGVRYWLNQWKQDSEHGTRVHNAIEEYILGTPVTDLKTENDRDINKLTQALAYVDEIEGFIKAPELKLFDEELGLAGTIDLLVEDGSGNVRLYDWKTNKAIKDKAYKQTDIGKEPLSDLPDCNLEQYSLQLSMYAYMLERRGKNIQGLTLVHLMEDKLKTYDIDYNKYKEYILKMLEAKDEYITKILEERDNKKK